MKEVIEQIGASFEKFKSEQNGRVLNLEDQLNAIETHLARQMFPGGEPAPVASGKWGVDIKGRKVPVLAQSEKMADHFRPETGQVWSIGDFVRGSMGIRSEASVIERGSATVPAFVSAQIIDAIRAKTRVIQAGSQTIVIDGPTNLCRIDEDPTVYEHVEGVEDISESLPVFSPVALNPTALVALIPLSMEVVQDSPNLDAALSMALAGSFAGKLDALSIAKILADGDIPTSETGQATNDWSGLLAAVGAMLELDQDLPKACISAGADYVARQGTSGESGWFGFPPFLANLLDLPTSSVSAGTAILGDFARGFGIAVRQELRLEVVRWAQAKKASHLLVAHARMAGYVLQPNALFIQQASVD
jgi:hypothetical protein